MSRSSEGEIRPHAAQLTARWSPTEGTARRGTARRAGEGSRAITHYETIERFGGVATQLLCRLETGRTHQIRIHLAEAGHPLVGERVYRSKNEAPISASISPPGPACTGLGFVHPITGQAMKVEAPLPEDLTNLIVGLARPLWWADRAARVNRRGGSARQGNARNESGRTVSSESVDSTELRERAVTPRFAGSATLGT